MAEEETNEQTEEAKPEKSKSEGSDSQLLGLSIVGKIVGVLVAIWLISASYYAFAFFALGMLPAIITAMLDKGAGRFASKTVTACNFIGMTPYLADIVRSYERSLLARQFMKDVDIWLFIYGSASMGWVMIWVIPQITLIIYAMRSEMRITKLKKEQDDIVDEWGEDVKRVKVRF